MFSRNPWIFEQFNAEQRRAQQSRSPSPSKAGVRTPIMQSQFSCAIVSPGHPCLNKVNRPSEGCDLHQCQVEKSCKTARYDGNAGCFTHYEGHGRAFRYECHTCKKPARLANLPLRGGGYKTVFQAQCGCPRTAGLSHDRLDYNLASAGNSPAGAQR
jgi:hypothetical protein